MTPSTKAIIITEAPSKLIQENTVAQTWEQHLRQTAIEAAIEVERKQNYIESIFRHLGVVHPYTFHVFTVAIVNMQAAINLLTELNFEEKP